VESNDRVPMVNCQRYNMQDNMALATDFWVTSAPICISMENFFQLGGHGPLDTNPYSDSSAPGERGLFSFPCQIRRGTKEQIGSQRSSYLDPLLHFLSPLLCFSLYMAPLAAKMCRI
jgi:hypothetical protein